MINYRVDDLGELLEQLRSGGVEIVKGPTRTTMERLRGSWTRTETRSSSGNRRPKAPEEIERQESQRTIPCRAWPADVPPVGRQEGASWVNHTKP